MTRIETKTEAVRAIAGAQGELTALSRITEREIQSVAKRFESLAGQIDTILNLAAQIIACIENDSVGAVLSRVQTLGEVAKRFIGERLQATHGILETVTKEVKLLRQLSRVTRDQAAIALDTKALSVLTNIEVARLAGC